MPLYQYQCIDNGHRFERIQKFSDPPVAVCPTCGSTVRKLMSSPAIQFKGSGWYITDYAKKSGTVESSSSKADGSERRDTNEQADKKAEKAEKAEKSESKTGSGDKPAASSESKPATPSKSD